MLTRVRIQPTMTLTATLGTPAALTAYSSHGPASRTPGLVGSGPSMQLVHGTVLGVSGTRRWSVSTLCVAVLREGRMQGQGR